MLDESNQNGRARIAWPLILSLLCLSIAALPFDAIITANRRSGFLAGDIRRIIQLSEIFGHGFGLAVVGYMIWVLAPAKRRFFPRLIACTILPGLVVHVVKTFVARRRPGFYYPEFTDNASETWQGILPAGFPNHEYLTQSFPSAHAATRFWFGDCIELDVFREASMLSSCLRFWRRSNASFTERIGRATCSLVRPSGYWSPAWYLRFQDLTGSLFDLSSVGKTKAVKQTTN